MKKVIILVTLLVSLSHQLTFPLFEGVKEKFSQTVARAKGLFDVKENMRCLRVGDNCSKARREMLKLIVQLNIALGIPEFIVLAPTVKPKQSPADVMKNAKNLLAKKENQRCIRKGDNCSPDTRRLLMTINLLHVRMKTPVLGLIAEQ